MVCHDGVLGPNGVAVDVCHVSSGRNDIFKVVVRVITLETWCSLCGDNAYNCRATIDCYLEEGVAPQGHGEPIHVVLSAAIIGSRLGGRGDGPRQ